MMTAAGAVLLNRFMRAGSAGEIRKQPLWLPTMSENLRAEILATGDEIRSGALIDSNSALIADSLEREGIEVTRHHCVGDDLTALVAVLEEIGGRADVAVVTGGLGPTDDDRTAEAATCAAGVDLVLDDGALAAIETFFRQLGRPMTRSNRKQAFFPQNSEVLPNPIGTAPGFKVKIGRCTFFCLPGVPVEMRRMMTGEVIPRLAAFIGDHRQISTVRTLSTFGASESMVGEQLENVADDIPEITVGFRAKFPEIQVRLYFRSDDRSRMAPCLDAVTRRVCEKLGRKIFSRDGRPMAAVVGDLLMEQDATLAVAESCTGGLIGHWLTNVPGSSGFFRFSGVTYANAAKVAVLDVSPKTIEEHGAVSLETVREMAAGARKISGATYAIATSGIAGPDGGTDEKPVGTVCIGLAGPAGGTEKRHVFSFGNRQAKKKLFAMAALDMLRRHLMEIK